MNKLYYGDCLDIMRREIAPRSVDLIYLDPPFNSNRDYHTIYKDATGRPIPAQAEAFSDMWRLNADTEKLLERLPREMLDAATSPDVVAFWIQWVKALRHIDKNLLAYLAYMLERILAMKIVLKPAGSLYFHCDPAASHYIKVLLDAIFGRERFRREIIWETKAAAGYKALAENWVRGHDVILYYCTSESRRTFNKEWLPYGESQLKRFSGVDKDGRRYKSITKNRRLYLDQAKGVPVTSVWSDIATYQTDIKNPERTGYATEKPVDLLRRIVAASSDPDDVVLDPFCGCATTLHAAHELGRRWIGVDITIHAVKRVAVARLEEMLRLKEGKDFAVEGVPRYMEDARDLWERDTYQFQKWAIEQVDGFVTTKRSADGGIDGRIFYIDPTDEMDATRTMIVEVKGGGNVGIETVRVLKGVLGDDSADMAGLIVMDIGKRKRENFLTLMAQAGDVEVMGRAYPRMQLLTVEEILEGKRFETPNIATAPNPQKTLEMD